MTAQPIVGRGTVPEIQCLACGNPIYLDDVTYANYQGRVVCPECKGHQDVVIQKKALVTSNPLPGIYEPIMDILAWEVPYDILRDLGEAAIDLGVGSYKSCVVMCRRCVQAVLLDKNYKDDELGKMIEAAKDGLLKGILYASATAVRLFGNSGAHPKDPMLYQVTKLQASLGLEVTKEILKQAYPKKVIPASQSEPGSNEP